VYQPGLIPNLYVDLDDVVAQTIRAFILLLETKFHRRVDFESVRSFHLGQSFQLSDIELRAFLRAAHESSVLRSIEPIPGAREALSRLQAYAHIVIVTGRPIFTYDDTVRWLFENQISHHAVGFLKKYVENDTGIRHWRRPIALRSLRRGAFTLAVEDSPKMAKYIATRLELPVALLDKPWNRSLAIGARHRALCTRCDNWDGVEEWVMQIIARSSEGPAPTREL
jgi:uncharacterized HAD superfamily protein